MKIVANIGRSHNEMQAALAIGWPTSKRAAPAKPLSLRQKWLIVANPVAPSGLIRVPFRVLLGTPFVGGVKYRNKTSGEYQSKGLSIGSTRRTNNYRRLTP